MIELFDFFQLKRYRCGVCDIVSTGDFAKVLFNQFFSFRDVEIAPRTVRVWIAVTVRSCTS